MTAPFPQEAMGFVFGFRSPYAWIANRLLERLLAPDERACIRFVPFWNPSPATLAVLQAAGGDFLYREMSKDRHLYILRDVRRLAAHFALDLVWPVDPPQPDWEAPHRLYMLAERAGRAADARRALFAARWEQGRDICDANLLSGIGRELGLDAAEVPAAAELAEPLRWCWQKRVFGLPFFTVGADRFWGVDRLPFALFAAGLNKGPAATPADPRTALLPEVVA